MCIGWHLVHYGDARSSSLYVPLPNGLKGFSVVAKKLGKKAILVEKMVEKNIGAENGGKLGGKCCLGHLCCVQGLGGGVNGHGRA